MGQRPLDDLRDGLYAGFEGGLYPSGANVRPAAHDASGREQARRIEPLDAHGLPAPDGRIAFAALGFSIARLTFDALQGSLLLDPGVNPALTLANCAVPSQDPATMADPTSAYWMTHVPRELQNANVTAQQVQVAWILTGTAQQTEPFPDHARTLEDQFVAIARNARAFFPQLRIAFVAPVPWMGYAGATNAAEPYYFEQGFALRWLVERQIAGDPLLAFDPDLGPAAAPWLAWGPYLWCDGTLPRSDGMTWECADVLPDGVHPSWAGRAKLAARLLEFLRSDPVATPWFLAAGAGPTGIPADVELRGSGTRGARGEPQLAASRRPVLAAADLALTIASARPNAAGIALVGSSLLAVPLPAGGGFIHVLPDLLLPFRVDGQGRARLELGDVPSDPALAGTTFHAQAAVFDADGPTGRFALTTALDLVLGD